MPGLSPVTSVAQAELLPAFSLQALRPMPKGDKDAGKRIKGMKRQLGVKSIRSQAGKGKVKPEDRPLSARYELFAQGIAQGKTGADAARDAGFKGKNSTVYSITANRLLKDTRVKRRIEELLDEKRKAARHTRESYIEELDELAKLAKTRGNLGVMAKAVELRGKVMGHYVERVQTEDVTARANSLPVEEQARILRKAMTRLAQSNPALAQALLDAVKGQAQVITVEPCDSDPVETMATQEGDKPSYLN